jgi:uncharacterized iron-regulated membrane protein
MIIQLTIASVLIIPMLLTARYHWITRRQPVRRAAPTGDEPWVSPRPQHRYTDPTPR